MSKLALLPRIIRLRDAYAYCGTDKETFNRDFRPHLTEAKIGIQGVGFHREEMDEFIDWYFDEYGQVKGDQKWRNKKAQLESGQESVSEEVSITSTSGTKERTLLDQLEQAIAS